MKYRIGPVFLVFCLTVLTAKAYAYDKPYIGKEINYRAKYVDTFVHLARDYNLGFVELRAANPGVDPWIPGEGTKLILPTRHILPAVPGGPPEGIVINIADMRLYYFQPDGAEPISVPIGVGREGLDTPLGTTTIERKTADPTWYPTRRMRDEDPELPAVVKPGPENPLGTHAMYLGWPTYAIHGTNRPFGIGRRISSGCIRLYPEDIKDIFAKVPVGTKVTVVDEPIKMAWINDRLYLEAHTDREQAIEVEEMGTITSAKLRKKDINTILSASGAQASALNWTKIYKILRERRGYPIKIAKITKQKQKLGPDLPIKEQVVQIYKMLHEKEIMEKKRVERRQNPDAEQSLPKTISYQNERSSSSFGNLNP